MNIEEGEWKAQRRLKRGRDEESLWEEMKSRHLEQRDSKMSDARPAT